MTTRERNGGFAAHPRDAKSSIGTPELPRIEVEFRPKPRLTLLQTSGRCCSSACAVFF
jgi:hypothetical protein